MVALRIRALEIRVTSSGPIFGVDVAFPSGLVVLRAKNSAGKSTLVQSVIYALGLEGMLSASRAVPLPHAMTDQIEDGEIKYVVKSSKISLEIENGNGEIVTVIRYAKSDHNKNLITIFHGSLLSSGASTEGITSEDKYVRDAGAASTSAGFHHWLAGYIGWPLPLVPKFDGGECPLYLECMFPLMLVEQKKAWTGIQARMPTQFRIRDVSKRAIEYILKLSVFDTISKRQQLRMVKERIEADWRTFSSQAVASARMAGGIIQGIDNSPMLEWPANNDTLFLVSRNNEWIGIRDSIERDSQDVMELNQREQNPVGEHDEALTAALAEAESRFENTQVVASETSDQLRELKSQLVAVETRMEEVTSSLEGNRSVRKLRNMGSMRSISSVHAEICPTCHQKTTDSLLYPADGVQPMSLDENIQFLESQDKIYRATKNGIRRSITAQEARLSSLRTEEVDQRATIRSLKAALLSNNNALSKVEMQAGVMAEARLRQSRLSLESIESAFKQLEALAVQWKANHTALKELGAEGLSKDDKEKVDALEKLFRELAKEFGVSSLDPNSIKLSVDTYKPTHDGFDLEFDLSASDLVRTIWAYLHALLELSSRFDTNHLGLLMLDEPRQQSAHRESFAALFRRASRAKNSNHQVIVATSEETDTLLHLLKDTEHHFIQFEWDKILRPVQGLLLNVDNTVDSDLLDNPAGEEDEEAR